MRNRYAIMRLAGLRNAREEVTMEPLLSGATPGEQAQERCKMAGISADRPTFRPIVGGDFGVAR